MEIGLYSVIILCLWTTIENFTQSDILYLMDNFSGYFNKSTTLTQTNIVF